MPTSACTEHRGAASALRESYSRASRSSLSIPRVIYSRTPDSTFPHGEDRACIEAAAYITAYSASRDAGIVRAILAGIHHDDRRVQCLHPQEIVVTDFPLELTTPLSALIRNGKCSVRSGNSLSGVSLHTSELRRHTCAHIISPLGIQWCDDAGVRHCRGGSIGGTAHIPEAIWHP
jgi:hypothetical protein